jgi:hypothetical protein
MYSIYIRGFAGPVKVTADSYETADDMVIFIKDGREVFRVLASELVAIDSSMK